MIVQVIDSARPSFLFRAASGVVAGLCVATLTSCSLFSSRDGATVGYYLPLTVQLQSDPSIAGAQLTYQDACGQAQSLPIGAPLQDMLKRKTGRVFEKVLTDETGSSSVPDGYVDTALGLAHVDLAIPRKAHKSYPAMVTMGLDFAYTAADGTVLYSKKIQSIGRGEVDVTEASCDVKGLDTIAQEAMDYVTDGMAKQLGTSHNIIDAAQARKAGGPKAVAATVPPPSPISTSGVSVSAKPTIAPQSAAAVSVPVPVDEPATVIFRAIVRNENRTQVLHTGEAVTIEIEVKNEGPGTARAVELSVTATPPLIERIPSVVSVGALQPGEVKHLTLDGKVGTVKDAVQAELTLILRAGSPAVQLPSAKKFLVAMKPASATEVVALPVDVVLLDNMAPDMLARAVKMVGGRMPISCRSGPAYSNSRRPWALSSAWVGFERAALAGSSMLHEMRWSWPPTSNRSEGFHPSACAPSLIPMPSRATWPRCWKSGCPSRWTPPPWSMSRSRAEEWLRPPPAPCR